MDRDFLPQGDLMSPPNSSATLTGAAPQSSGKRSRREGWRYRYLPRPVAKQIHWVFLGIFFLALLIGVTVAGVFFMDSQAKIKDRNDPHNDASQFIYLDDNSDVTNTTILIQGELKMNNFDSNSGIAYNLSLTAAFISDLDNPDGYDATNESLSALPLICVFAMDDSTGSENVLIVDRIPTDNNSIQTNLTMDGLTSHYPFDTYTGALDLLILVSTNGSLHDNQTCAQLKSINSIPSTSAPVFVSLGQTLDGFHASVASTGDNGAVTFSDGSSGTFGQATITVRRDPIIRAFNVLLFIVMWLLTIATVIAVGQVITYSCEPRFDLVAASAALLFAIPQLRQAQPGIPLTPTIFDAVGYYWNIALVGLSTFILIVHFSWQLRHDRLITRHGHPDEEMALKADDDDSSR